MVRDLVFEVEECQGFLPAFSRYSRHTPVSPGLSSAGISWNTVFAPQMFSPERLACSKGGGGTKPRFRRPSIRPWISVRLVGMLIPAGQEHVIAGQVAQTASLAGCSRKYSNSSGVSNVSEGNKLM